MAQNMCIVWMDSNPKKKQVAIQLLTGIFRHDRRRQERLGGNYSVDNDKRTTMTKDENVHKWKLFHCIHPNGQLLDDIKI